MDETCWCFGVRGAVCSRIVLSLELPIRLDECKHGVARARAANHGSIGDSAVEAGLTLVRVLRGGLGLGEYLGLTARPGERIARDCPSHPRPDLGAIGEGTSHTAASGIRALARLHRQLRRIEALSFLPQP